MFDLNLLLSPLSEASPCGPNLEYDPVFLQLEAAAKGKKERTIGYSTISAVNPDWQTVRTLSLDLFSRTKDLRVAVYLLRSEVNLDGIHGLAGGLKLIAGLLRDFNEAVHPLPDEDVNDMAMRLNALTPLGFWNPLTGTWNSSVLADVRALHFGDPVENITGRVIELVSDAATNPKNAPPGPIADRVHAALRKEEARTPGLLFSLSEAREAVDFIDKWILEKFGASIFVRIAGRDSDSLEEFIKMLIEIAEKAFGEVVKIQEVMKDGLFVDETTSPIPFKTVRKIRRPTGHHVISDQTPQVIASLDLEKLLKPISDSEPCGPDLEYDSQFLELELAVKEKPEQQMGDSIIPAEEPDWFAVLHKSMALFSRTKDLRVAMYLLQAATRVGGIGGAAFGLKLVHGLIADYWDVMHPVLEAEDNYDLTYRKNILRMLSDSFVADLRSVAFGDSIVAVTGRQIELAPGDEWSSEHDRVAPESEIRQAVMAEIVENPELLQNVADVRQAIVRIEGLLSGYFFSMGPDLSSLRRLTERIQFVIKCVIEERAFKLGDSQKDDQQTEERYSDEARREAMRVLTQIGEWLEQSNLELSRECRRLRRLNETNFIELVRCLMPDRVDRVKDFFDQVDR